MNFLPCRLEQAGEGLNVRLSDTIAFAVPAERVARYKPPSAGLTFGIRPEHLTEAKTNGSKNLATFDAGVEVVEPMGNETMVFVTISGTEVAPHRSQCRRQGRRIDEARAHLDHMHLIDNASGKSAVSAWRTLREKSPG
jgi:multiple sugar transport system ATP-binding protein